MYTITNVHYPFLVFFFPQTNGKLTDMLSFYNLPSTIIGHKKYNTLYAAYSYYNVSNNTPLVDLMRDSLILAKKVRAIVLVCPCSLLPLCTHTDTKTQRAPVVVLNTDCDYANAAPFL